MAYNWPAENLTVQEKVGVGTETPTEKLEVKGNLKLNTGVAIGEFSSDTTFATPTHQAVPTTQAVKTYVNAQVAAVTTALATKAEKGGSLTQSFQTDNLKVQGNLEVTGQTTFRNIEQHQGDLELGNEDTDQVKIHGKLLSTHSSGTLQVVSPLQVVGTITANKFVGDGSDLTGLRGITQWVSGAGGTLFYNGGNVGIGIDTPQAKLDVKGAIRAGNSDIYFSETNHNHTGLGNLAGFAAIENAADYGALMILGRSGTPKGRYVRLWDYLQVNGGMDITGNMGIGTATPNDRLDVAGGLRVLTGTNPIRFTSVWSGFPDAVTNQAEISNDTGTYKTLMIVGNRSAGLGRRVSVWDRLEVNGILWSLNGTVQSSDRRLKRDIATLPHALAKLLQLRGVSYYWNDDNKGTTRRLGLIAQEVEEVFPELVEVGADGMNALNYTGLIPVLVESLKEQYQLIMQLKDEINTLKLCDRVGSS